MLPRFRILTALTLLRTLSTAGAMALAIAVAGAGGCSRGSSESSASSDAERRPAAQEAKARTEGKTSPHAAFAMGYTPRPDSAAGTAEVAIAKAQARVRQSPAEPGPYIELTQAFLRRKRESADPVFLGYARDALAAAETLAPADPKVLTVAILFLFEDHKFAEAAKKAQEILASDADNVTAFLLLSDARLELGDYDGAIDTLQEAIDRLPDLRSLSRVGYLRWLHGDVEGALQAMHDALTSGSRDAEARAWCHVELGMMLWHKGELDPALRAADEALALVGAYVPALALKARVLVGKGDRDGAIALLDEVVGRLPTAEHLVSLSELLGEAGKAKEAEARLMEAEKQAGHDPLPLSLYYSRHNLQSERALALAEKAVAERSTIYTQDALALAKLRAGRVEEAKQDMASALARKTPDARLTLHRALIEHASGDARAAAASLEEAKKQNPYADPVLAAELTRALAGATSTKKTP